MHAIYTSGAYTGILEFQNRHQRVQIQTQHSICHPGKSRDMLSDCTPVFALTVPGNVMSDVHAYRPVLQTIDTKTQTSEIAMAC